MQTKREKAIIIKYKNRPLAVQSVWFDRNRWNLRNAKNWIKKNNYKNTKVDVTKNQIRFRQKSPKHFIKSTYRTKKIGDGSINLVVEKSEKRNYPREYKKFSSSNKSKKYRAELNRYNQKHGTYGNHDGLDASHKNGKIIGFEQSSKNKGRREKSRLKVLSL